ncbi:MAG: phosphoglycolate phosphatase [Geminicoccaceae bacterium]
MSDGINALIFDLDGTLVETAGDLHLVLAEILAEAGLEAPSLPAVRSMIGDGARVLIERALVALDQPAEPEAVDLLFSRFRERYAEVPCRRSEPYPGARDLLVRQRAAGFRLGLCTNKPQGATDGLLRALDIDGYFDAVIGGDALPGIRKPDPAHLAAVLDRLVVEPAAAIMIGDSRNDLLTARGLGIPCILVSFGYTDTPASELGADMVIDHLDEVPAALEQLRHNGAG